MAFILQGNPKLYDIDRYLTRDSFIYWTAKQRATRMKLGDPVFIWRSGKGGGAVAFGRIAELARDASDVHNPEALGDDLWKQEGDSRSQPKVGIEIEEVRLSEEEGMLLRDALAADPEFKSARILTQPQSTVFELSDSEFQRIWALWSGTTEVTQTAVEAGAYEGEVRLRQHRLRERNRFLAEKKKEQVRTVKGRLVCEVCHRSALDLYPEDIGDDFFEVHHRRPLSEIDKGVRTTLADLALVCANCHRLVHRSTNVEENFENLIEAMQRRN